MAPSITPVAKSSVGLASIAWPLVIEALLVVAVIVILLPLFDTFAADDDGRERRFGQAMVAVRGLPVSVLPALCASHGAASEPLLRERLCGRERAMSAEAPGDGLPLALVSAGMRVRDAFRAPFDDAQARLSALRAQQREGLGDLLALSDAIAATDSEFKPYLDRYALDAGTGATPLPLACAFELVEAATGAPPRRADANTAMSRANALVLLAAALDGHGAVPALAGLLLLPVTADGARRVCAAQGLADALAKSAVLLADARHAEVNSNKNEAMRVLLRTAGWQWAGWMLAGLVLLNLARRTRAAATGVALALATWAFAAWIGRVPWPLATDRAFIPGREADSLLAMPAPFVLWLLGAAVLALAASPWLRKWLPSTPQTIASRVGYPGVVLATGIGWLLLLDLSGNGHFGNRYLALYHHGHLWLGMLLLTVIACLRQPLGRALASTLSRAGGLAGRIRARVGVSGAALLVAGLLVLLIGAVGAMLSNVRQLTSEIGRAWLIVGAAWFFFLRGAPLAERLARRGGSLASLTRYILPLVFVVLVLIGAMVITRDMGPLLIAAYGAGAFLAASIAMWLQQRRGATGAAYAVAVATFAVWILAVTLALFQVGALDDVTAARLENVAAPLASANDQLALVTWFQAVAPPAGFGVGAVPWCGYGAAAGCAGVPAQIHSDYTFTALVGAFGWTAAWALTLGCAIWLHRLIRHHGRVTLGEPRFLPMSGRVANDDQAFLSWLSVAWVVLTLCQLAVTVAGNLAVIPLTGVTFPFVSFGMTSLAVNMALVALCLNVNVPGRA